MLITSKSDSKTEVSGLELTARKENILSAIVQSYVTTGEPVGSKNLISQAGLNVSSATVRNEMADLESKGYLVQPHTSAGRVPTQQGYRYYVDHLMKITPVSQSGRNYIGETLGKSAESPESILQSAADLLTNLTDFVAFATTPDGEDSRIRRISFVQTGAHAAMAVVMASNGLIKTRLFRCEFMITPEILGVFDKAFNETFAGIKLSSINKPFIQTVAARFGELSLFMPNVLTAIMEAARLAKDVSVYHSGYNKLMLVPDENFIAVRRITEFLNNEHDLANMLEALPPATAVTIGRENSRVELSSSSVVSSRYFAGSDQSGVLAVIGPVAMNYGRVTAILECITENVETLIGKLVEI